MDESYFAGKSIIFHNEETPRPLGRAAITSTAFYRGSEARRHRRDDSAAATFAVWALPRAHCTKRLFISPACDDLAQVVHRARTAAAAGAEQARRPACTRIFTRAEEVGFAGALAATEIEPRRSTPMPTLSLETSNARGFARVEAGPVLRVGDRLSIFDSRITHWLETAFRDLQAAAARRRYQRLLMGGGTCEASVFQRAGLPTGALCVALNNYHNMGPGKAIRAESISLRDWQGLYDFLFFLATEAKSVAQADAAVAKRFA